MKDIKEYLEILEKEYKSKAKINNVSSLDNEYKYGYVYAITDGEYVKIGKTDGLVQDRLSQLQTSNPRVLKILFYSRTQKNGLVESYLHRVYSRNRINGEWFKMNKKSTLDHLFSDFIKINKSSYIDEIVRITNMWRSKDECFKINVNPMDKDYKQKRTYKIIGKNKERMKRYRAYIEDQKKKEIE